MLEAQQVLLALLEAMELQVLKAHKVTVLLEPLVLKVPLELEAQLVTQVQQVLMELMEQQELEAQQVIQAPLAHKVIV